MPEAERLNRQLSPEAARAYAEQVMGQAVQQGLLAQETRYLDLVERANGLVSPAQLDAFWLAEDGALWETIRPTLLDLISERSVAAAVSFGNVDGWTAVNESVISWAEDYYASADGALYGSIPNLNLTSRTQVLQAFTEWQRGELQTAGFADGLPQLVRSLEPVFGATRAENIAVSETTRIFTESKRMAADQEPTITGFTLQTAVDELVCPICGQVQGQFQPKRSQGFVHPTMGLIGWPPFHPRCRCDPQEATRLTQETPDPRRSGR